MHIKDNLLKRLRAAALPAPSATPEAIEPPVCNLFEHCKGCPYPAHGFNCWGQDGDCMRQTVRKIQGIKEDTE